MLMNAEIFTILQNAGTSAIQQIRNNMSATGTNSTGKSSKSLTYEIEEKGTSIFLRVLGREYFAVVETGRRPTPQYTKPSREFVQSIKEWAQAKGKPEGSAYAIAKSIHQKGTKLFREGGRRDVYSNVEQSLVDQVGKDLLDKYANLFLVEAVQILDNGNNRNQ
jgi:hypothetical protein